MLNTKYTINGMTRTILKYAGDILPRGQWCVFRSSRCSVVVLGPVS